MPPPHRAEESAATSASTIWVLVAAVVVVVVVRPLGPLLVASLKPKLSAFGGRSDVCGTL